jgi:hypothetical protein
MKKIIDEDTDTLLTREEFKKQVFARTKGRCCVPGCNCDAVDAHHIMDRKLWNDGGYYLSNGAALCSKHHLDAEQGKITPIECITYMRIEPMSIKKPDKITSLTEDEYFYLLLVGKINKWGE